MQLFFSIAVAGLCATMACVDPKPPEPPGAQADPQVVEWLDKLEAAGRDPRSFQANVVYEKLDELLRDKQTRTGDLIYMAADDKANLPPRFAVVFRQFIADKKVHPQQLEFIFDGQWLVEKDHKQKRFEKRQVIAPD